MPNTFNSHNCHSFIPATTNTNKTCGSQTLSGEEAKAAEASVTPTTNNFTEETKESVPRPLQSRMPNIKVFSGSSHPDLAQRIVGELSILSF